MTPPSASCFSRCGPEIKKQVSSRALYATRDTRGVICLDIISRSGCRSAFIFGFQVEAIRRRDRTATEIRLGIMKMEKGKGLTLSLGATFRIFRRNSQMAMINEAPRIKTRKTSPRLPILTRRYWRSFLRHSSCARFLPSRFLTSRFSVSDDIAVMRHPPPPPSLNRSNRNTCRFRLYQRAR